MMMVTRRAAFTRLRTPEGTSSPRAFPARMIAQIIAGTDMKMWKRNQLTTDRTMATIACVRMPSYPESYGATYPGWPYTGCP